MVQFAVSNIVSRLIVVRQLILIRMEAYSRENGGGGGKREKPQCVSDLFFDSHAYFKGDR